jgi:hypothetical protein
MTVEVNGSDPRYAIEARGRRRADGATPGAPVTREEGAAKSPRDASLSLTFDHRAMDGAPTALFLQTVIDLFNFGER